MGLVEHLPSMQEGRGRGNLRPLARNPVSNQLPASLLLIFFFFSHIIACGRSRYRKLSTQADSDILNSSSGFRHYTVKITDVLNFMQTTVTRVETDAKEILI